MKPLSPRLGALLIASLWAGSVAHAQLKLVPQQVKLQTGRSFSLDLPANFRISPAAQGLKRPRFFAKAPDGRIFITDIYDRTDNKKGAVYILDGWDARTGKFAKVIPYLKGLHNPNSVAFYTDKVGQQWFYLAQTDKLTRTKFTAGETKPSATPQTLATFPAYGLSYKYGGWHLTRTIAIGGNSKIYVSVGSSQNAGAEKEAVRASVLEMNPDGTGQRIFANGLRNAVGLKWIGKFLFATNQGVDHLGPKIPNETFYALKAGTNYGWPRFYQNGRRVVADPKFKSLQPRTLPPLAYATFPAHSSALGFEYFDPKGTEATLRGNFLVALHGSGWRSLHRGYSLVLMNNKKPLQTLLSGFLKGKTVYGRPCDVLKLDEKSFLFSDDYAGVIYYVRRKS